MHFQNILKVQSFREGQVKTAVFEKGIIVEDAPLQKTKEHDGTLIQFVPDNEMFENFIYMPEYLEQMIQNYVFLNAGLTINLNEKSYFSKNGLLDLLSHKTNVENIIYPIIHLKGEDIEIAITHGDQYGEEYHSFVNGQYTSQGGTHLLLLKRQL